MEILTDKIRGCLVGGAIGDALGYSVEFMTYPSIIRQYGSDGITSFTLEDNLALFSDDTQMTLFTANGLLNGIVRNNFLHQQSSLIDNIGNAYIDWYKTQLRQNYRIPENERNCWISGIPQLYVFAPAQMNRQRASCVAALGMKALNEGYTGVKVQPADEFVPDYLRKSQAERQREAENSPDGQAGKLPGDY